MGSCGRTAVRKRNLPVPRLVKACSLAAGRAPAHILETRTPSVQWGIWTIRYQRGMVINSGWTKTVIDRKDGWIEGERKDGKDALWGFDAM